MPQPVSALLLLCCTFNALQNAEGVGAPAIEGTGVIDSLATAISNQRRLSTQDASLSLRGPAERKQPWGGYPDEDAEPWDPRSIEGPHSTPMGSKTEPQVGPQTVCTCSCLTGDEFPPVWKARIFKGNVVEVMERKCLKEVCPALHDRCLDAACRGKGICDPLYEKRHCDQGYEPVATCSFYSGSSIPHSGAPLRGQGMTAFGVIAAGLAVGIASLF